LTDQLSTLRDLPTHLAALQILVDRCPTATQKKEFIVWAGACEAISREDGYLMITANQLETA
jgi:hypothetical protein